MQEGSGREGEEGEREMIPEFFRSGESGKTERNERSFARCFSACFLNNKIRRGERI